MAVNVQEILRLFHQSVFLLQMIVFSELREIVFSVQLQCFLQLQESLHALQRQRLNLDSLLENHNGEKQKKGDEDLELLASSEQPSQLGWTKSAV